VTVWLRLGELRISAWCVCGSSNNQSFFSAARDRPENTLVCKFFRVDPSLLPYYSSRLRPTSAALRQYPAGLSTMVCAFSLLTKKFFRFEICPTKFYTAQEVSIAYASDPD